MTVQKTSVTIVKLEAEEGKVITDKKTGEILGKVVYLAKTAAPGDYTEVDEPVETEQES